MPTLYKHCKNADGKWRSTQFRASELQKATSMSSRSCSISIFATNERLCQAVSPNDEPYDYPATVHCAKCGRWFCDAHAEDEEWHPCMLPPGDEGGEA